MKCVLIGGPQDGLKLDLPGLSARTAGTSRRRFTVSLRRSCSDGSVYDVYSLAPVEPGTTPRLLFVRTHRGPMEGAVE